MTCRTYVVGALLMVPLVIAPSYAQDASATFYAMGDTTKSCGQFVRAAEDERKTRPSGASSNSLYSMEFVGFSAMTDGFLTAANWIDPVNRQVGQSTDNDGRMAFLETYCRVHPLEHFVYALMQLRLELLKRANH
jgi:hypothetical protein